MTLPQILFYFFATLTIGAALTMLYTKNLLYAVLALLIVFLGVSALYVFAGADFLAVSQLVIYIGGVIVLLLFGVMLTNREGGKKEMIASNRSLFMGLGLAVILLAGLIYYINATTFSTYQNVKEIEINTVKWIGITLIKDYLLVFEVIGVLLLVTLIGVVFISGAGQNKWNQLKK